MDRIASRHNARVKSAAKLRQRRQRQRQGRFLIDGDREIARAIAADCDLIDAFVRDSASDDPATRAMVADLEACGAAVSAVADEVYDKLAFGDRAGGMVAVGRARQWGLADLRPPPTPLIAVIESLEKPGNVGAVLRSGDGAGVDATIVADPRTDLFNPNTIRASLGTVFGRSVCGAASLDAKRWLDERQIEIYAATPDAEKLYTDVDYLGASAIVLGSEATGLSKVWSDSRVTRIKLPMLGIADSLNVSAAAAAIFYEARRQRDVRSN
ncbi:MAG: TrmH family RNA methyltransferase [Planctomycetota bacterium]